MPDSPRLLPDADAPDEPVGGEPVGDAVFEDVRLPNEPPALAAAPPEGDSGAGPDVPDWHSLPVETFGTGPAVQLGDPFLDGRGGHDGGLDAPPVGYDPAGGFRIDFPAPAADATTALVRPRPAPPVPATEVGGGGVALPPPAPPPVPPRADARRAARDRLRMLRRSRWIIAACTLLGVALAALYTSQVGPEYTAYSVLLVDPTAGTGSLAGAAPGAETSRVLNQALVLQQAPELAVETARGLLARPEAQTMSVVRAAAASYGEPVTPERLGAHLQESVVLVTPEGENVDALRVEASAGAPSEAALVAALYTDEYLALSRSAARSRVEETAAILDAQVARLEGEVAGLDAQTSRFMTAENAAGLDAQTQSAVSQIGQLQAQLDLARVAAQTRAAELAQLEADLASVPARLDVSAEAPSQVQTTQLDTEVARYEALVEQIYAQNPGLRGRPAAHPDLARLDARLRALRADRREQAAAGTDATVAAGGLSLGAAGANGGAYVADLQRQISQTRAALGGARAQADALGGRIAEAERELRSVPGRRVELDRLDRERAAAATSLQAARTQSDAARLAESTQLGFAQVVRGVQVPREPSSPNLPLNLLLGGALGFLVGLGTAFVRHQTDSQAHTPADLEDHGFAVVGTVPDLTEHLRRPRYEVEGASVHPGLVTLTRSFGPEAEAFRHLHAGLYGAGREGSQVVLVMAPDPGTGASLTAANLAVAAAQAGRRVLLVDADLRRPTVAALLGLGEHAPLGEGPEGSNLVYWSTAVPGLFAMTPRQTAERPDQLWAPHQVGELLQNLRAAFDLVVVDAPPALTSADATLLAPHADGALLVAEADATDLDAMTRVAMEIVNGGLHRIGAVLNRFDPAGAVGYWSTAGVRHTSAPPRSA